MATILYMNSGSATGALPSQRTAEWSNTPHDWPTISYIETFGTSSASTGFTIGGNFTAFPMPHMTHIRTFISKPLRSNVPISGDYKFVAQLGESKYEVNSYYDWETKHWYLVTTSIELFPAVYLYAWNGSSSRTISFATGSQEVVDYTQPQTSTLPLNTMTLSSGERIVCELWHRLQSQYGWLGFNEEYFAHNFNNSYISFSQNIELGDFVSNSGKFPYHVLNKNNHRLRSIYNFGFYKLDKTLEAKYFIYSYRYIELYMETDSTARGRVSFKMSPRASTSYNTYIEDYSQKWFLPEPSLHKYYMIDDFEGYPDLVDAIQYWTVSDGAQTFSALKTFSSQNLENYELISFYAMGSKPTNLTIRFKDKYTVSSDDMSFLITDRWERYEREVPWASCNKNVINTFQMESAYNSEIIIDDIVLLDCDSSTENTNWMKMNLTGIEFSREQKLNTFKIPFRQSELIQFSGEKNGEGQLTIRSIDSMQSEFLDECLKMNTPLYFRYKNMGYPIMLRDTERIFKQIIPKQVSSQINIPFYEIYDSSIY